MSWLLLGSICNPPRATKEGLSPNFQDWNSSRGHTLIWAHTQTFLWLELLSSKESSEWPQKSKLRIHFHWLHSLIISANNWRCPWCRDEGGKERNLVFFTGFTGSLQITQPCSTAPTQGFIWLGKHVTTVHGGFKPNVPFPTCNALNSLQVTSPSRGKLHYHWGIRANPPWAMQLNLRDTEREQGERSQKTWWNPGVMSINLTQQSAYIQVC